MSLTYASGARTRCRTRGASGYSAMARINPIVQSAFMSVSADGLYKMSDANCWRPISRPGDNSWKGSSRAIHSGRGCSGSGPRCSSAARAGSPSATWPSTFPRNRSQGPGTARDDARTRSAQGRCRRHRNRHSIPRRAGAGGRARRRCGSGRCRSRRPLRRALRLLPPDVSEKSRHQKSLKTLYRGWERGYSVYDGGFVGTVFLKQSFLETSSTQVERNGRFARQSAASPYLKSM